MRETIHALDREKFQLSVDRGSDVEHQHHQLDLKYGHSWLVCLKRKFKLLWG